MRILFISQYFYPEQFSNNSIAEYLKNTGHEVDVLTCVPNYGKKAFYDGYSNHRRRRETWRGIRIFRSRTIARGRHKTSLLLNYLFYPLAAIFEYHRRRIARPDVTFVSMPSPLTQALVAIYLKKRFGVPAVFWVQDIWPESPIFSLGIRSALIRKLLFGLCNWIYRQADVLLVQSPGFTDRMKESGVASERLRVFPNTAPENYVPLPSRRPSSAFELMFAGNIGESQDFETILATADLLRDLDIRWTIVGSGRHEDWLKDAVRTSGLSDRFAFLGRHPEHEMPALFARADAMIVSLKDQPIFELTVPYKVQCYLACGRPIVGSINGEAARIIEQSGAGYVAPAGKPAEFAQIVRRMATLPYAQRDAMGAAGREFFERNYASDRIYGLLDNWLTSAARKSHRGRSSS